MMVWLVGAVLFLAYSNGANDNFKGVATLFGSGTSNYHRALWWATLTTLAGSVASIFLSQGLVAAFSGKGLVPVELTMDSSFLLAVAVGAALTVILATLTGIPISTTHALTGALVGAGLVMVGGVNLQQLGKAFFLPLAVSPFLALALTALLYPLLHKLRVRLGVQRELCLCLQEVDEVVLAAADGSAVVRRTGMKLAAGEMAQCKERYLLRENTHMLGFDVQKLVDAMHYLSAGMVGFARGLNDTPKIVALLVAATAVGISMPVAMTAVGIAMAAGGLLNARKVATTMSQKIVPMNHGQGFTANVVTAFMVIVASRFGVPVSTTHVSVGSLFGLGAVTGAGRWHTIRNILLAWLVTLPLAALLAAICGWSLTHI